MGPGNTPLETLDQDRPFEFPLVGRADEERRIRRHLFEEHRGPPAFLLHGRAGVGKTRLIQVAIDAAGSHGVEVFHGRAFSLDSGLSYAAISDAFVAYLRSKDSASLQRLTRGRLPELYSLFPSAAPGGEAASLPLSGISPEDARITLFWGFVELLRGLSRRGRILVVIDDLQWADPSAIQLLHFAIRQVEGDSIRFLCSSTEGLREQNVELLEFETSLVGAGLARNMRVSPLSPEQMLELVTATFSVAPEVAAGFSARLYDLTRGNPLFATEAIRAMVESGHLVLRDGAWSGWDVDEMKAPRGVRDLVVSRLLRLSDAALKVGEIAATMEDRIRVPVLSEVSGLPDEDLYAALDELRAKGIIQEGANPAVSALSFTHPLIRECAYQRITPPRRERLHQKVATALEGDGKGLVEERAEELAFHFHRSGAAAPSGKAIRYLLAAGRRALDRYANLEAERHLKAAIEVMDRERSGEHDPDREGASMDLAKALNRLGRYDEAIDLWEAALGTLGDDDALRAAELRQKLGRACFWSGRPTEALEHYAAGLVAARDDAGLQGRLRYARGLCLQELARWEEAAEDATQALALAEGDLRTQARAHQLLTLHHTWTGDPAHAREHGALAVEKAEASGDPMGAFLSHLVLAMLEGLTGNLTEMRLQIGEARTLADTLRSPILGLLVDEITLQEAHATGAWNDAVALGERAIAQARALGQQRLLPRLLVWTALPILARGDVDGGRPLVEEAWALSGLDDPEESRAPIDVHVAVPAYIGRATLCLAEGDVEAATTIAEQGLEMADRSGAAIWSMHHLIPLLGESYLLSRNLEGAERLTRRLRRDATRMDHFLGLAWADACEALVTWLSGQVEEGTDQLRDAADRLETIPIVYDAARVRRQYAGRLAELGRTDEALAELRRAHAVFRDLGAEPELEKSRGMFKELETRPPPKAISKGLGGLTGRELEIARLVASRRSNKAIGQDLGISPRTVTTHLTNIYKKLDVDSRGGLVDLVRERGWAAED